MVYGKRITRPRRTFWQKKEALFFKSGLVVLVLLLLLISLIFLSRLERFEVSEVVIDGNTITSNADILKILEANTFGYYFKMFSKRNFLIYPKERVKNNLLSELKRIKEADLDIRYFKNLQITVNEREPDTLWCGQKFQIISSDDDSSENQEKCYFVDIEGLVYAKAPSFSGNVFLKTYGETAGSGSADNPVGNTFLPATKYQNLKFFKNAIEKHNLFPIIVAKLEAGDMEMHLKESGRLIYNLDQDILRLTDDLGSILEDQEFKEEIANRRFSLDYIDLRLGNKVYYKFK